MPALLYHSQPFPCHRIVHAVMRGYATCACQRALLPGKIPYLAAVLLQLAFLYMYAFLARYHLSHTGQQL